MIVVHSFVVVHPAVRQHQGKHGGQEPGAKPRGSTVKAGIGRRDRPKGKPEEGSDPWPSLKDQSFPKKVVDVSVYHRVNCSRL